MKPTIGWIVHYTDIGGQDDRHSLDVLAAIIMGVNADGTVSLYIFYRNGELDMPSVPFTTEPAGTEGARGCWTWPAREDV